MKAAARLQEIVDEIPSKLLTYSDEISSIQPAPGKWCKKEIIGHLIDSASNNHQRFVRMQINNNLSLPKYKQDEWVAVQRYRELPWKEVVRLWEIYNRHILHIFRHLDPSKLSNTAEIGDYGSQTLQFIVDDYVDHIEHHLAQVFR
jgi:hypothetical protein